MDRCTYCTNPDWMAAVDGEDICQQRLWRSLDQAVSKSDSVLSNFCIQQARLLNEHLKMYILLNIIHELEEAIKVNCR